MQIRFITKKDNDNDTRDYKLLGYYNSNNFSEDMKLFNYMMNSEIPMQINTKNIADTDGDEYFIQYVTFASPAIHCEINPYIEVYVE